MASKNPPVTAKIYQFPVKTRQPQQSDRNRMLAATDQAAHAAMPVMNTSGWYHDVAIAEADAARRR